MYYVYLLKSRSRPTQPYIGSTCDLRQRLKEHNEDRSPHTAKFRPWTLGAYVAFADEKTATTFEKYLKSGSRRAFIKRHFLQRCPTMFFWRKFAEPRWVRVHEDLLQAHAPGQLVIVRRPGRKRLELEIICRSRSDSSALLEEFGGRIKALPGNWLGRFARGDSKPIKIGKRLMVVRSSNELQGCVRCPQRSFHHLARANALMTAHSTAHTIKRALLVIPATLAFGTGEHVTTAMSLRFLEQLTRRWKRGWSLVDLGTGSGILALAAKCFGADRALGIDNDPVAISTAKSNARLNKIRGATFQLDDVQKWNSAHETDVITANLYSHLLITILPKLGVGRWLILSGILRSQEDLEIVSIKRRAKWISILAHRTHALPRPNLQVPNFCGAQGPPLQ
jgi:ribosomal protein L11 methyltransferase